MAIAENGAGILFFISEKITRMRNTQRSCRNPNMYIPITWAMYNWVIPLLLVLIVSIDASKKVTNVKSAFMKRMISSTVIFPEQYDNSGEKFPVIYLLHGYGGNHKVWSDIISLQRLADQHSVIFICPDGGNNWYIDGKKGFYQTFFIKELIPFIDSSYRTINNRNGRALCGISMGGYGAIALLSKYPDIFSAASSICGVLDIEEFPDRWELSAVLGEYHNNRQVWIDNSITTLCKKLAGQNCAIVLDCGTSDFALQGNRKVHQLLLDYGVKHDYYERPGTHTLEYPVRVFRYHLLYLMDWL